MRCGAAGRAGPEEGDSQAYPLSCSSHGLLGRTRLPASAAAARERMLLKPPRNGLKEPARICAPRAFRGEFYRLCLGGRGADTIPLPCGGLLTPARGARRGLSGARRGRRWNSGGEEQRTTNREMSHLSGTAEQADRHLRAAGGLRAPHLRVRLRRGWRSALRPFPPARPLPALSASASAAAARGLGAVEPRGDALRARWRLGLFWRGTGSGPLSRRPGKAAACPPAAAPSLRTAPVLPRALPRARVRRRVAARGGLTALLVGMCRGIIVFLISWQNSPPPTPLINGTAGRH